MNVVIEQNKKNTELKVTHQKGDLLTEFFLPDSPYAAPVGYPQSVNLKQFARGCLRSSVVTSIIKRSRMDKCLVGLNEDEAREIYDALSFNKKQKGQINNKELSLILSFIYPGSRQLLNNTLMEKNALYQSPEVSWLSGYTNKKRGWARINTKADLDRVTASGITLSTNIEQCSTAGLLIMAVLPVDASNGFNASLFPYIAYLMVTGVVDEIYQDIVENTQYAADAANALFAIVTILDSRLPLDYLYSLSPEAYQRWFHGLTYDPTIVEKVLCKKMSGLPEYEPLALDFEGLRLIFGFKSNHIEVKGVIRRLWEMFNDMEFDPARPYALMEQLDGLKEKSQRVGDLHKFMESWLYLASKEAVAQKIDGLRELLSQLVAGYTDVLEKPEPTFNTALNELNAKADELKEFGKNSNVEWCELQLVAIDSYLKQAGELEARVTTQANAKKALAEQIKELVAANPVSHRTEVSNKYAQLETLLAEMQKFRIPLSHLIKSTTNILVNTLTDNAVTIECENGYNPDHDADEQRRVNQQLRNEIAGLQRELMEYKARVESLNHALAVKRDESAEQLTDDVRYSMKAVLTGKEEMSVTDCLTLLKALYPQVQILPSAWASAEDSTLFERTPRLWENLNTLAGDYLTAINGGTPDAEARKLFTTSTYAANESETTSGNSQLRAEREYYYQGEKVYFEQHLRIGRATDVRRTLRVHFAIIDEVLVIAYCGEHKKILN